MSYGDIIEHFQLWYGKSIRWFTETKWAIKVPFEDDWLYVTQGSIDNTQPVVYNNKEEARKAAQIWGPNAEVVVYKGHSDG